MALQQQTEEKKSETDGGSASFRITTATFSSRNELLMMIAFLGGVQFENTWIECPYEQQMQIKARGIRTWRDPLLSNHSHTFECAHTK